MDDNFHPLRGTFTFRHDGGPVGNTIWGTYVIGIRNGEEQLFCFERYRKPIRMKNAGDTITAVPPAFFLFPGVQIALAQKMPSVVNGNRIAGKGWIYTQAGLDAVKALGDLFADLLRNPLATLDRLNHKRPEREPDEETLRWVAIIVQLKDKEKLSWPKVGQRLLALGWDNTLDYARLLRRRYRPYLPP